MLIRETTEADLKDIWTVERAAFKTEAEANLTKDLLADPTAKPTLSLLAYIENQPVGHILFTKAYITGALKVAATFLAPLSIVPKYQKQGIGGALVRKGIELQA
jgi:putative acetyltransferase